MRFEEAPAQRTAGGADVVAEAQPGTGLNGETSGAQQSRRFVGFDLEAMRRDGKTRLLAGLKVRELFVEGQVIGHVVDVKIQDVQGSIDRLCKMLGWNEPEKIEHTFKPEEMTEAQLRAEADKILRPPKNKKEQQTGGTPVSRPQGRGRMTATERTRLAGILREIALRENDPLRVGLAKRTARQAAFIQAPPP